MSCGAAAVSDWSHVHGIQVGTQWPACRRLSMAAKPLDRARALSTFGRHAHTETTASSGGMFVELGNESAVSSFSVQIGLRLNLVRWLRRIVTLIRTPYVLGYIFHEQRQPCHKTCEHAQCNKATYHAPARWLGRACRGRWRHCRRRRAADWPRGTSLPGPCAAPTTAQGPAAPASCRARKGKGLLTATRQHGRQADTSSRCNVSGGGAGMHPTHAQRHNARFHKHRYMGWGKRVVTL
jgi:hypothetical protein